MINGSYDERTGILIFRDAMSNYTYLYENIGANRQELAHRIMIAVARIAEHSKNKTAMECVRACELVMSQKLTTEKGC